MATPGERISVGATATKLSEVDDDGTFGKSIRVKNKGANPVDLGDANVTTGNGYSLEVDEAVSVDLNPGEDLYGVTAAGTETVHVLHQGV